MKRSGALSDRLYGGSLYAFPKAFRARFAAGMRYAFQEDLKGARERGVGRVVQLWTRTLTDVVVSGIRERIAPSIDAVDAVVTLGDGEDRTTRSRPPLHRLGHEFRHAGRRVRKHAGFSSATVLTLGLGIGATTAIFSVVYSVLLQPLPYHDSGRLVSVGHRAEGGAELRSIGITDGAFFVYGDEARSIQDLTALFGFPMNFVAGDRPERVAAALATYELPTTLGIQPEHGRWYTREEALPGGPAVAVISHALWLQAFGGQESALGRSVLLNGVDTEVIGVMPPEFSFPEEGTRAWLPLRFDEATARSVNFQYAAVARLREGATAEQAEQELDALFARTVERFPAGLTLEELRGLGVRAQVRPLKDAIVGDVATVLWPIMAAVAVILLVACANVANLFLVQADGRYQELAVRLALGAERRDLVRHFLVESAVLGLLGGALGLGLTYVGLEALRAAGPEQLPRLQEVGVTWPVLAFATGVSLVVGLLFGTLPALRVRMVTALAGLRAGDRGSSSSRRRGRARNVLVTAQLALALMLLAGAGLMFRTFGNLMSVDPGFEPQNTLTFELSLPFTEFPGQQPQMEFHQRVLDRIAELPGVESATASPSGFPIAEEASKNPVWVEDAPPAPGEMAPIHSMRIVMPEYFETLEIPILEGRSIERADLDNATGAVVVSTGFRDRYWPGQSPLGKRVRVTPQGEWLSIVGLVADTHGDGLAQPPGETVYWGVKSTGDFFYTSPSVMDYAVRTTAAPATALGPVRELLASLTTGVAVGQVGTLQQSVDRSVARISFTLTLLGIAASMSLLLGCLGVYGVLSYAVSQRRREIGVRIALGARPMAVRGLVMRDALFVVAAGIVLGLGGAAVVTRLLGALLYGVEPIDPITYAAVSLILVAVALLASYGPARRASSVDPAQTLKAD